MRAKCNAAQTNSIKEDIVKTQTNWKNYNPIPK